MISLGLIPTLSGLDLFVILTTLVQHFILKYNDQIKFRKN
jgi:hypothetical protein